MRNSNLTRTVHAAAIAGLIGFSSLGFAQSEALSELGDRANANQATAAQSAPEYPQAQELATALDEYNRQDTEDRIPGHRLDDSHAAPEVTQVARELSSEIEAYNASASEGLVPSTSMPADDGGRGPTPDAQELAAELTRYNASGGSLSAVRF
ncbi:hypothetical protein [Salinisphaera orenii]|uniref:DUF4148 domain-containing protein n=1 Tax=Salinisphaera orenii YIM 95161 TaxID=1051139 RepID=A0A423PHR1_9GAMM|nr:hypothetical protein [Salinisphaera halophila]ROO25178.1 hypothetical protein SAHL_14850 [Salinisphaera halophila YIM 95161]